EGAVEAAAKLARLQGQPGCDLGLALESIELGRRQPGAIDITLQLDQRDRRLRQGAIAMSNAVPGIFPALVEQARLGLAFIVDEAVAIVVRRIEPLDRPLHIGAEFAPEFEIAGP